MQSGLTEALMDNRTQALDLSNTQLWLKFIGFSLFSVDVKPQYLQLAHSQNAHWRLQHKEKFTAVLLFLMREEWQQKVHHRLAKVPPCVICYLQHRLGLG